MYYYGTARRVRPDPGLRTAFVNHKRENALSGGPHGCRNGEHRPLFLIWLHSLHTISTISRSLWDELEVVNICFAITPKVEDRIQEFRAAAISCLAFIISINDDKNSRPAFIYIFISFLSDPCCAKPLWRAYSQCRCPLIGLIALQNWEFNSTESAAPPRDAASVSKWCGIRINCFLCPSCD